MITTPNLWRNLTPVAAAGSERRAVTRAQSKKCQFDQASVQVSPGCEGGQTCKGRKEEGAAGGGGGGGDNGGNTVVIQGALGSLRGHTLLAAALPPRTSR